MPRLTKGTTFQSGDTVTADSLNELIDNAEFVAGSDGATDNTTLAVHSDGYLEVKDGGVGLGKLANLSSKSVIGNNSSSTATPTAVPINDLLSDMNNATAHTGGTADSDGLNTTGGTDGLLSAYDKTKLNSIEVGAEVNPSNATTSASGLMSSTDKQKLNGIATNANNYSHPTGDGNLHVPATGTGNVGKVLTAGSSAGSFSWQTAPGQSVVEGSWTLDTTSLYNLYGSYYTGTSNVTIGQVVQGSSLYYHRYGRLAVLSGTIYFKKSTSSFFRTSYSGSGNWLYLTFDNPVDTLVSGGTAKIYPIGLDYSAGSGSSRKKKTVGHGFAEWYGDTTNASSSSPQRYGGRASCNENPGGTVFTLQHEKTELMLQGAPNNWYIGGVFFEYSFLLDPAFA